MIPEYINNKLFWNGQDLIEVAEKCGTPIHICSKSVLRKSVTNFLNPFKNKNIPVRCFFSVKTNPVPEFLLMLKEAGIGMEVISEYELWLIKKLGFSGKDIIINGPAKSEELLKRAFQSGAYMLTVESLLELEKLLSIEKKKKAKINISLRVCPSLLTKFNPTLDSGSKDSPFGFLSDSPELWQALESIQNTENLVFSGFQMHLGSGIKSDRPYRKALSILQKTILKAAKKGALCRTVNIGGGFGLPTAPMLSFTQLASNLIMKRRFLSFNSTVNSILPAVARDLRKMLASLRESNCIIDNVLTEPGRILSGNSQIIILTVLDIIERKKGRRFLICDGGGMSLSPMLLTERHTILPLYKREGKLIRYSVLGNLPSSLDKVSSLAMLPEMKIGDRLAILDTGAYFISFNNNFAGPKPAVVVLDEKGYHITRKRETFDEVISRDVVPKKQ